jgi:hypothetical protein
MTLVLIGIGNSKPPVKPLLVERPDESGKLSTETPLIMVQKTEKKMTVSPNRLNIVSPEPELDKSQLQIFGKPL